MKRLSFQRPGHDAAQLLDQLLSRFPEWVREEGGVRRTDVSLSSDGPTIDLTVPPEADEGAIAAIVAAHAPVARPAAPRAPTAEERLLLREFASGTNFASLAQANAVVRALIVAVRHRFGELG